MYPEFVPVYIALGVIALLLIVTIILLIVLLKKQGSSRPRNYYAQAPAQPQYGRAPQNQSGQASLRQTLKFARAAVRSVHKPSKRHCCRRFYEKSHIHL